MEERHWWHRSRLEMTAGEIDKMGLPAEAAILDLGCGTGGTTRFLERYGRVTGIDYSALAIDHAQHKVVTAEVRVGDANLVDLYFPAGHFDLITMFNVLYHKAILDDRGLLDKVKGLLRPGGFVLLTEPAYRSLWREHDVLDDGRTRYSLGDFRRYFRQLGLEFVSGRYFNAISYPACLALAVRHRLRRRPVDTGAVIAEMAVPSATVNEWLIRYMRFETWLYRRVPLPIGVSLMVVGRKRGFMEVEQRS